MMLIVKVSVDSSKLTGGKGGRVSVITSSASKVPNSSKLPVATW